MSLRLILAAVMVMGSAGIAGAKVELDQPYTGVEVFASDPASQINSKGFNQNLNLEEAINLSRGSNGNLHVELTERALASGNDGEEGQGDKNLLILKGGVPYLKTGTTQTEISDVTAIAINAKPLFIVADSKGELEALDVTETAEDLKFEVSKTKDGYIVGLKEGVVFITFEEKVYIVRATNESPQGKVRRYVENIVLNHLKIKQGKEESTILTLKDGSDNTLEVTGAEEDEREGERKK